MENIEENVQSYFSKGQTQASPDVRIYLEVIYCLLEFLYIFITRCITLRSHSHVHKAHNLRALIEFKSMQPQEDHEETKD